MITLGLGNHALLPEFQLGTQGRMRAMNARFQHHYFIPEGRGITDRKILEAIEDFAGNSTIDKVIGGWNLHYDDLKIQGKTPEGDLKAMMAEGWQVFVKKFRPIRLGGEK